MVDCVVLLGPLWAHSAFVFEDLNRKLKGMFHGTQHVHSQIMTHFLGFRKVSEIANVCMLSADENIQKVYNTLSNQCLPIQRAKVLVNGTVGFGAPHQVTLSESEAYVILNTSLQTLLPFL